MHTALSASERKIHADPFTESVHFFPFMVHNHIVEFDDHSIKKDRIMFVEERQHEIARQIQTNGKITISEITEKYGISDESARRDLRLLEKQRMCKRTHGGASFDAVLLICPLTRWNLNHNHGQKQREKSPDFSLSV